jgi:nucleoside-triphosphatase THEP1
MAGIFVLSDEINSGKTTSLLKWKAQVSNVYGVLSPKGINGRIFQDAKTGEQWPMEANEGESTLEVGRFKFSQTAFEKAIWSVSVGLEEKGTRYVIFDEIGPLEMRNSGFHSILSEALTIKLLDPELQLLIVIRRSLLKEFIEKYQVEDLEVFSVIDFSGKT